MKTSTILAISLLILSTNAYLFTKDTKTYSKSDENITVDHKCNTGIKVPEYPDMVVMSQYLSVGIKNNQSSLAYIFYGCKQAKTLEEAGKFPTLFWFQGGPGGSSQFGNFQEFGPITIVKDGNKVKTTKNPFTWANDFNLVFMDNPIGVGFSVMDGADSLKTNMDGVAEQFTQAMINLYTNESGCFYNNPLNKTDIIIAGESYAGKYVPSFGQALLKHNLDEKTTFKFPIKGIAIGDGFTDPQALTAELGAFGYNLGFLTFQERVPVENDIMKGYINIEKGTDESLKEAKNNFYAAFGAVTENGGGLNGYNFRRFGDDDFDLLQNYCNSTDFKTQYKLNKNTKFVSSNGDIFERFSVDFMKKDCVARVEFCLDQNLPTLIYQGQNDVIVPTPGTQRWVDQLMYSNSDSFAGKEFQVFTLNGTQQVVGYNKTAEPLTFTVINDAGHMVPADQPEPALAMITNFYNKHVKK